ASASRRTRWRSRASRRAASWTVRATWTPRSGPSTSFIPRRLPRGWIAWPLSAAGWSARRSCARSRDPCSSSHASRDGSAGPARRGRAPARPRLPRPPRRALPRRPLPRLRALRARPAHAVVGADRALRALPRRGILPALGRDHRLRGARAREPERAGALSLDLGEPPLLALRRLRALRLHAPAARRPRALRAGPALLLVARSVAPRRRRLRAVGAGLVSPEPLASPGGRGLDTLGLPGRGPCARAADGPARARLGRRARPADSRRVRGHVPHGRTRVRGLRAALLLPEASGQGLYPAPPRRGCLRARRRVRAFRGPLAA